MTAAYKIAEAEAKSFLASEAVKEAERISRIAEETDSMLQLAKEIFEQCKGNPLLMSCYLSFVFLILSWVKIVPTLLPLTGARGEIVTMA